MVNLLPADAVVAMMDTSLHIIDLQIPRRCRSGSTVSWSDVGHQRSSTHQRRRLWCTNLCTNAGRSSRCASSRLQRASIDALLVAFQGSKQDSPHTASHNVNLYVHVRALHHRSRRCRWNIIVPNRRSSLFFGALVLETLPP